eukprot:gene999-4242_t
MRGGVDFIFFWRATTIYYTQLRSSGWFEPWMSSGSVPKNRHATFQCTHCKCSDCVLPGSC